jgi:hypothetical protein
MEDMGYKCSDTDDYLTSIPRETKGGKLLRLGAALATGHLHGVMGVTVTNEWVSELFHSTVPDLVVFFSNSDEYVSHCKKSRPDLVDFAGADALREWNEGYRKAFAEGSYDRTRTCVRLIDLSSKEPAFVAQAFKDWLYDFSDPNYDEWQKDMESEGSHSRDYIGGDYYED